MKINPGRHIKSCFKFEAGFTLLELVVVIGIIAIIVTLLLPVISKSRRKGQQIGCVNNLHQLGIGLQNFVGDNHGYPSIIGPTNSDNPGLWISQLASGGFGVSKPYTNIIKKGIWRCPSAPLYCKTIPPVDGLDFCSYGYNVAGVQSSAFDRTNALGLLGSYVPGVTVVPKSPGFLPVRESAVTAPSNMMAIGDSLLGGFLFVRLNFLGGATARHQGRINVLFCDGHVESPLLNFVFEDTRDAALVRWNRDHQPHREKL